jgi:hypothetical protein
MVGKPAENRPLGADGRIILKDIMNIGCEGVV